jgi:hypothetical protein
MLDVGWAEVQWVQNSIGRVAARYLGISYTRSMRGFLSRRMLFHSVCVLFFVFFA